MNDSYKVQQLNIMLKDIQEDEYALARLKSDSSKAINLDEGALNILVDYYSGKITASTRTSAKYVNASDSDLRYMDFNGRIPKKIKDATLEYMDTDGVSLADAFEWACREYAPEGSELWKAWYYSDFRKFIPSAYEPQYLDFKKYPLKYTIQGSSSDTSIRSAITASYEDEDNEPDLYDIINPHEEYLYAVEIYTITDNGNSVGDKFWQQLDVYNTPEEAYAYCENNPLSDPDEFYVIRYIAYVDGEEVETGRYDELR